MTDLQRKRCSLDSPTAPKAVIGSRVRWRTTAGRRMRSWPPLPRGGVLTGAAIAEDLDLPLDVLVVRKLGTPGHEELAMGAIAPGGVRALNDEVVSGLRIPMERIEHETVRQKEELECLGYEVALYDGSFLEWSNAGEMVWS